MADRDADARRFAEAMNLTLISDALGARLYFCPNAPRQCDIKHLHVFWIPPASAPLHEHLAFVGRVAETLPQAPLEAIQSFRRVLANAKWHAKFIGYPAGIADDLSHAVLIAAITAKDGSR